MMMTNPGELVFRRSMPVEPAIADNQPPLSLVVRYLKRNFVDKRRLKRFKKVERPRRLSTQMGM
jgi:predicted transcriptional regulator